MANPQSPNEQRAVKYLVQVLQRNPLEDSEGIIRGRNRLLGLQKKVATQNQPDIDFNQLRRQREKALEQIALLRKIVWSAPQEQLQRQIAGISTDRFPDIQATVERLTTIVEHRSQLPSLVAHPHFDGEFFSEFKQVLAWSPQEAAVLKERQMIRFNKSKNRKRGKKMIQLLRNEQPALYAMEAAWLDSLVRQKKTVSSAQPNTVALEVATSGGEYPWWVYILGLVLLRVLFRLFGAMNE